MNEPGPSEPPPQSNASGSPALPPRAESDPPPTVPTAKPLTPEEQMALYEADLKENDWGHQPC